MNETTVDHVVFSVGESESAHESVHEHETGPGQLTDLEECADTLETLRDLLREHRYTGRHHNAELRSLLATLAVAQFEALCHWPLQERGACAACVPVMRPKVVHFEHIALPRFSQCIQRVPYLQTTVLATGLVSVVCFFAFYLGAPSGPGGWHKLADLALLPSTLVFAGGINMNTLKLLLRTGSTYATCWYVLGATIALSILLYKSSGHGSAFFTLAFIPPLLIGYFADAYPEATRINQSRIFFTLNLLSLLLLLVGLFFDCAPIADVSVRVWVLETNVKSFFITSIFGLLPVTVENAARSYRGLGRYVVLKSDVATVTTDADMVDVLAAAHQLMVARTSHSNAAVAKVGRGSSKQSFKVQPSASQDGAIKRNRLLSQRAHAVAVKVGAVGNKIGTAPSTGLLPTVADKRRQVEMTESLKHLKVQMLAALKSVHEATTVKSASATTSVELEVIRKLMLEIATCFLNALAECTRDKSANSWLSLPLLRPEMLRSDDMLIPIVAKFFLRQFVLKIGSHVALLVGLVCFFLDFSGRVQRVELQVLSIALLVVTPIPVFARLNRSLLRKIVMQGGQILVVFFYILALVLSLCALVHRKSSRATDVISVLSFLPILLFGCVLDAYPDPHRILLARAYFGASLIGCLALLVSIVTNSAPIEEIEVYIFRLPVKFSTVAVAAIIGLLLFSIENLARGFRATGPFVVLKSDVAVVLVETDMMAVLKAVHSLLVRRTGHTNSAFNRVARAESIMTSPLGKRLSGLGQLLMPTMMQTAHRVSGNGLEHPAFIPVPAPLSLGGNILEAASPAHHSRYGVGESSDTPIEFDRIVS